MVLLTPLIISSCLKICGLRVHDSALSLLSSYLTYHLQKVMVEAAMSLPTVLQFGGDRSAFGPVLFMIYISGFFSLLVAHGVAYYFHADETQFDFQI